MRDGDGVVWFTGDSGLGESCGANEGACDRSMVTELRRRGSCCDGLIPGTACLSDDVPFIRLRPTPPPLEELEPEDVIPIMLVLLAELDSGRVEAAAAAADFDLEMVLTALCLCAYIETGPSRSEAGLCLDFPAARL